MTVKWKFKYLSEIASVSAGNSAPQAEALFKDGTYPFFRTSDVGRIGFGDIEESSDYLNEHGIRGLRLYPKGTILFPKSGASTFLNHRAILGVDGYVSSHLATIVADKFLVNERFLLYFLTTISAQDLIQDHAYPSLNLPVISAIQVPHPSLAEQQRIVSILDDAFKDIERAVANAEKNLAGTQEILNSYIHQNIISGGSGNKVPFREIVSELITGPFGSSLHKADYVDDGIPVINPQNIVNGSIVPLQKTMVSDETRKRLSRFSMREGDIVIARRGEMGRCAIVSKESAGWLCGTGSMLIRLKNVAHEKYITFLLQSPEVRSRLEGESVGATMNNLNQDILLGLIFHMPSIDRQREIIFNIENLSNESKRLEEIYSKKMASFGELKKSLLNHAFTGQLH